MSLFCPPSTVYLLLIHMAYHLGVQKNPKIILLVLILLVLGVAAFMIAIQCGFFVCGTPLSSGFIF